MAVIVESPARLGRRDLNAVARAAAEAAGARDPGAWQVTVIAGERALVKVPHTEAASAREFLAGVDRVGSKPVRVVTIGTSGTIRAARRRYLGGGTDAGDG